MTTVDALAVPGRPAVSSRELARRRRRERTRPVAWWGMMMLVLTEGMLFTAFLSAYYYTWAISDHWPQGGIDAPDLVRPALFSLLLVGSSIPTVLAERAAMVDRQSRLRLWLAVAFVMAAAFLANQVLEERDLGFALGLNAYTSLFACITLLHGLHVLGALCMSAVVQAKAWTGRIDSDHDTTLRVFGIYWHFVDGVWVAVFGSLYVAAHLFAH